MTKLSSLEPHVGCIQSAMEVIGNKWTALILRDLASHPCRFGDFERSIPQLNPRTLSNRLDALQAHDIIEMCDSEGGLAHRSYRLTKKGQDLIPVLRSMAQWGEKYPHELSKMA